MIFRRPVVGRDGVARIHQRAGVAGEIVRLVSVVAGGEDDQIVIFGNFSDGLTSRIFGMLPGYGDHGDVGVVIENLAAEGFEFLDELVGGRLAVVIDVRLVG